MLAIAISMSLFFGFISQTLLTKMGVAIATLGVCFFIFISVVFDMVGIAVASAEIEIFEEWKSKGLQGSRAGLKLCQNSEKVCSFCADVVGDICSTLCGAGGACIVLFITRNISLENLSTLVSIITSSLIAGIMIFFKALMKEYSLKNSNKIILKLGKLLEKIFFKEKKKNS